MINLFKKKELKRYNLRDKSKIYHFYEDCFDVVGELKKVSRDKVPYPICETCKEKHKDTIHKAHLDLEKDPKGDLMKFFDNVKNSDMTEDEKLNALKIGTVRMFMLRNIYTILDNMNEEN